MGFLRRRMIAGDLPSAPGMTPYKGGQVSTEEEDHQAGSGEVLPGGFFPEDSFRSKNGRWCCRKSSRQNPDGKNFIFIALGPGNFYCNRNPAGEFSGSDRFRPEKIRSDRIRRPGIFSGSRELIRRVVRAGFLQRPGHFPVG
jgi:hypothetical protein